MRTSQSTDHEITITLGADGSIQTEAKGVKGAKCYDLTAQLEKALGTVAEDARTREYSEKPKEEESVRYSRTRH